MLNTNTATVTRKNFIHSTSEEDDRRSNDHMNHYQAADQPIRKFARRKKSEFENRRAKILWFNLLNR
jgi:hypothetical protein